MPQGRILFLECGLA